MGRLDSWLLKKARVVAFGNAEGERYERIGVPAAHIARVPLGAELPLGFGSHSKTPLPRLPEGRMILVTGPLEAHKGIREAVWTLDILRYLYPDLFLVLAGEGSERTRVEAFTRAIGVSPRVVFTGPVDDLTALLEKAELVWVPSLREGGRCAALEAMSAGRPVVASRLPGLVEIIAEGETGFLVPPKDKASLARQTRVLLDDAALRQRFGTAGQQRAAKHFPLGPLIEQAERIYCGSW
jgi:glycosyltransferase involved in cell wall biosynthesis